MPVYDGINADSITHQLEIVGSSFFKDIEQGTLSTKVPLEIFSDYKSSPDAVWGSRMMRFRAQPYGEIDVTKSYVSDIGIDGANNYFFLTSPQNTSNLGDKRSFVLTSDSNVGLGTTNPTVKLHVEGSYYGKDNMTIGGTYQGSKIRIGGGGQYTGAVQGDTTLFKNILVDDTITANVLVVTPTLKVTTEGTISNLVVPNTLTVNNIYSLNDLYVSTNNNNIYMFNSNVGIGTTGDVSDKLFVYGNARVSNTLIANYVGIGTIPVTNLHVAGTVSATKDVNIDGLYTGAKMRLGSPLILSSPLDTNLSSNLSVGGELTSSNIKVSNLDVKYITSTEVTEIRMGTNVNVTQNLTVNGAITATTLDISNVILSNIFSPTNLTVSATQDLILNGANVGIGTTEPLYYIHINKDVLVTNVNIQNSLTAGGDVTIGGTYQGNRIRVGNQLSSLETVGSNIIIQGSLTMAGGIKTGTLSTTELFTSNTQNYIENASSNVQLEIINLLGDAGISLKSNTQSPGYISQSNVGDLRFENNGAGNIYLSQRGAGGIHLQTSQRNDILVLDTNGRVGISSSTPAYTFDMSAGTARLTGFYVNPFNSFTEPKFYLSNNLYGKTQTQFINADGRLNIKDFNGTFIRFFDEVQQAGSVTQVAGNTNFNSTSDYRLKENIKPLEYPLRTVCSLNPVQFTFKNHTRFTPGFLAHEVQRFIPSAVVGFKDALTENGDIVPQQMDKTHIIPYLVAAIKELKTRLEALENKQ